MIKNEKIKPTIMRITSSIKNVVKNVLPLLKNKVFHVTSFNSYKSIIKDGCIKNNKNRDYSYTFPQSEISYGRLRGYICLFDLRNISDEIIEDQRKCLDFLIFEPIKYKSIAYFIISPTKYSKIISFSDACKNINLRQKPEMIIPKVESFYPENINIEYVEQIIIVKYYISSYLIKNHNFLEKVKISARKKIFQ